MVSRNDACPCGSGKKYKKCCQQPSASLEALRDGLLNVAIKWGTGWNRKGERYPWMVDGRELMLSGTYARLAARLLWAKIKPYRPEVVAGMDMGANPLIVALMYESRADGHPVDGVIIRKQSAHNKRREGRDIAPGERVVLVDDLINHGTTQRNCIAALQEVHCNIVAIGVLIDFELAGSKGLREQGYSIESLFTMADLGMGEGTPSDPNLLAPVWAWSPLNTGVHQGPKSAPRIVGGHIYVGSDQGFVMAFDMEGHIRWRYQTHDRGPKGIQGSPLVFDSRVYVGDYAGYVTCLDAASGRLVWETRPCMWIGSAITVHRAARLIYVGVEEGESAGGVVALDADTGHIRWRAPSLGYTHSSPCFDTVRGQVICGCNDGFVYCLDALSGETRWEFKTGDRVKGSVEVDPDGVCFIPSMDGCLYAVAADSGVLRWHRKLSTSLYTTPLVYDDLVVVCGFSGRVVALERRGGRVRWIGYTGRLLEGSAARLSDGSVMVGSTDGHMYVFNGSSGRLRWRFKTDGPILSTPGVGDGVVAVPSCDGRLYVFKFT